MRKPQAASPDCPIGNDVMASGMDGLSVASSQDRQEMIYGAEPVGSEVTLGSALSVPVLDRCYWDQGFAFTTVVWI